MPLADAFDLAHLDRQTAGDADLQQEVLGLFRDQCRRMLAQIAAADASGDAHAVAAAAHTLKGAALGVGAFQVAEAAASVEIAVPANRRAAVHVLVEAAEAAQKALQPANPAC